MASVLRMPEVAAAATEAVLTEWLLPERASFTVGDALASVETEKALVDIEADSDGMLLKLLVPNGKLVDVGAPIAVLAEVGEDISDVGAVLAALGVEPGASELPPAAEPPPPQKSRAFASPLARKLAKEAGLPIEDLAGTGPGGRIVRRDVEAALATSVQKTVPPSIPEPVGTSTPDTYDEIPHTRLRKAIAARLQQSKREAPHFYLRATIRADRLVELRSEINEGGATRVSLNDLIVKAVAAAHARVPEMNATWTEDAVRRPRSVDIAVAVATERGLMTPVLRDVPRLTVTAVAAQVRDLAARAREGKLKQDELEGGTISVTNLGMHAVEDFAAIVNPPHAAILAVGAVRDEPVVEAGAVVVGKTLKVTLSVDHRPVDGAVAAQWLKALVDVLEHPALALA